MSNKLERKVNILNKFLEKLDLYGVCGFWVNSEETDHGDSISVFLVIDEDFIRNSGVRPDHLGRGIRTKVSNKIKDFLGFENIYVGSIAKKCH